METLEQKFDSQQSSLVADDQASFWQSFRPQCSQGRGKGHNRGYGRQPNRGNYGRGFHNNSSDQSHSSDGYKPGNTDGSYRDGTTSRGASHARGRRSNAQHFNKPLTSSVVGQTEEECQIGSEYRPNMTKSVKPTLLDRLVGSSNESFIFINGVKTSGLIDSGSIITSISEGFYHSLTPMPELCNITEFGLSIQSAGGAKLPYKGYIEAEISAPFLSNSVFNVPLLVVSDTECNKALVPWLAPNVTVEKMQIIFFPDRESNLVRWTQSSTLYCVPIKASLYRTAVKVIIYLYPVTYGRGGHLGQRTATILAT